VSDIPLNIRVDAVAVRLGRTRVLDGLTLAAGPGITGLLGPNGAGKTTLLRVVATVLTADAGRVRLLGYDPTWSAERLEVRRRLGYFPQEPGLYRTFTAFEFVDYVAILKEFTDTRARHAEVRRVLDIVGLRDRAHKRIRTLSGGMRRRVALAQALLGDPALLVLDEPTVGLDPEQRLRFRETVSHLGEDRVVLLSTHQTEDVAALCSYVHVLDRGQIIFSGTPSALADQARRHVWVADTRDPSARVAVRLPDGRYRHVGAAPVDSEHVDPSVEDGYLMLLGERALGAGRELAA
jgi:ABC-2 type transport system ATP-binding protein